MSSEHTTWQKKRRQEMLRYEKSDERLVNAIQIAARVTKNPELSTILLKAADRLKHFIEAEDYLEKNIKCQHQ